MPHYALCGWQLDADQPLPLLQAPVPAANPADIHIEHGPVTPPPGEPVFSGPFVQVFANGQALLRIGERLALLVSAGRHIRVAAAPGVAATEIMTFLLGPALGILCHQRRQLPLHGASLRLGERALMLVGHSGAGKSTTTAALLRRGHQLLCDDISVVDAAQGQVRAGYPSFKLWQDSAAALAVPTAALSPIRDGMQKFHVPVSEQFHAAPCPLGAIVILSLGNEQTRPQLQRHDKLAALALLQAHVYRHRLAQVLGAEQACFQQLGQLVSQVPVLSLRRPNDLTQLDAMVDILEEAVAA